LTARQETPCDFGRLESSEIPRISVAAAVAGQPRPGAGARDGQASARLVGTLVHRLVQRLRLREEPDEATLRDLVDRELRTGGPYALAGQERSPDADTQDDTARSEVGDPGAIVEEAAAAYGALSRRPDVQALYRSGDALHEVPFTLMRNGRAIRGTIDCLVRSADGRMTVLEFKTGRPRPEDRAQAELYRQAVQAVFPHATVAVQVVYASLTGTI
jgi:ATP-dependent exoDNAse (exonuclease V) beta subunit